jgi:hypothetical protein
MVLPLIKLIVYQNLRVSIQSYLVGLNQAPIRMVKSDLQVHQQKDLQAPVKDHLLQWVQVALHRLERNTVRTELNLTH